MKPVLLLVVVLLLCIAMSSAQIPRTMSYQGVLTDSTGAPKPDGSYSFTFRLYEASSGGSAVGTQQQTLQVKRGLFSTVFGQLLNGLSVDRPYWLSLQVESEPELSPRIPLTSVPYSISSIHSDTASYALAAPQQGGGGWSLTGNAGTTAGTNFVGTADGQAFDIRTNNILRTRITTKGQIETYNTGQSVFIGEGTGTNDDLTNNANVFVGFQAGSSNTTGSYNTANGSYALASNTEGFYNTANGRDALRSNTAGSNNTANGSDALRSNTTGSDNTANGYGALYFNTTGFYNTGVGFLSLNSNTTGSNNTANGSYALNRNTTGSYNTANGYGALYFNITGSNNTANGRYALYFNTGSNNTANGYGALANSTTSEYNVAFGHLAGADHDNGWNNVFLGANTDVNGAGYFNVIAVGQGTVVTASSTARFGNPATGSYGGWANWTNVSDARFKRNIKTAVPGIDFINKLRPVTYNLDATGLDAFLHRNEKKEDQLSDAGRAVHTRALQEKEAVTYTGFIAQEVETAARELGFDFSGVDAPKNENDTYGLRYAEFVVPLVKAVQEQQRMMETQQKEIEELKAMVKSLREMK